MPLALLLHDTWRALARDADRAGLRVDPIVDIGERLALVGQRMRTAYLVRWFGSEVPTQGSALRVSFVNLREVLARASDLRSRQSPVPVDAGMAGETVLGMVGTFAGWTFSPGVQFVAAIGLLRSGARNWWLTLLAMLNVRTAGGLGTVSGLFLGAVSPISTLVWAEVRGTAQGLSAVYEGIVAVAEPLRAFWEQLTGPRDQIRNPGLRALMEALDRVAVLVPHLFGAVAYLIVRLVPRLVPLAEATRFLVTYASALVGGITDAVLSLVTPLKELFAPEAGPGLHAVLAGRLIGLFGDFGDAVAAGLTKAVGPLLHVGAVAYDALGAGFAQIGDVAEASILHHPARAMGQELGGLPFALVGTFLLLLAVTAWNAYVSAKGKPGWAFTTLPFSTSTPSPPTPSAFPPFPTFPLLRLRPLGAIATGEFDRSGTPPDPFALTPEADRALRYRPPSVFRPAAVETARRWQDSARVRESALRLLPMLRALLPAAARPYLTDVAAVLGDEAARAEVKAAEAAKAKVTTSGAVGAAAGAALRPGEAKPKPDHPVKAPAPIRVRPRIRNLFVEVPSGLGRARADRWVATLRKALDAAPLTVPTATPSAAPTPTPTPTAAPALAPAVTP